MEILWTGEPLRGFMVPKLVEMDTNVGNNLDYVSYGDLNEVPVYSQKNQFYSRINPNGSIRGYADARHSSVTCCLELYVSNPMSISRSYFSKLAAVPHVDPQVFIYMILKTK
ncbi:hypothetical protein Zmor_020552 [Zophobas morio]|uniref:Uncharacterized protein n=1 Tax=Zophobas morio TaxID=2755281 RepID=A0AA38I636_9CUCU|nr:hypothetical protein Zmor_020552 [Zophobas morio]